MPRKKAVAEVQGELVGGPAGFAQVRRESNLTADDEEGCEGEGGHCAARLEGREEQSGFKQREYLKCCWPASARHY